MTAAACGTGTETSRLEFFFSLFFLLFSELQCFDSPTRFLSFPTVSFVFSLPPPPVTPPHCPSPPAPAQRGCGGWTCVILIGLSDKREKKLGCFLCYWGSEWWAEIFFTWARADAPPVWTSERVKEQQIWAQRWACFCRLVVIRGLQWWTRRAGSPRRLCPLSGWRSRFHPEVLKLGERRRRRRRRAGHWWETMEWKPHLQQVESRGRRGKVNECQCLRFSTSCFKNKLN